MHWRPIFLISNCDTTQVRDPELVRACGVEVALHEVHRASAARIRLRRLESTSTDRALEAV